MYVCGFTNNSTIKLFSDNSILSTSNQHQTMPPMETPTPTLFDLASLTYNSAEETSYYGFYYHFLYIIRKNLAPPGITVDGVTSGEDGDKMTISLMDFAAVMWLEKIDPRLAERVQIDFRVPISEGQRL